MTGLNLIPPQQKKTLQLKRLYTTIKELVMLFLLFTSIVAIMLLLSRYFLEKQLTNLINRNATAIQNNSQANKEIAAANRRIEAIQKIQEKFKTWSGVFLKVSPLTPDGISYDYLKIYRESGVVELSGSAKTRQELVKLQTNMENSGLFKSFNIPIGDKIAKENNKFNIQAEINLDKIP